MLADIVNLVYREPSIVTVSILFFLIVLHLTMLPTIPCPPIAKEPSHNPIKVSEQARHELLAIMYKANFKYNIMCWSFCVMELVMLRITDQCIVPAFTDSCAYMWQSCV